MMTDTERLDWLDGFAERFNARRMISSPRAWRFDVNHNRVALRLEAVGINPVRLAIDEATSPGARHRAEPDPARTDADRLDWLDARNQALNGRYGTRYGWCFYRRDPLLGLDDADPRGMTIREAIDLAAVETPLRYAAA